MKLNKWQIREGVVLLNYRCEYLNRVHAGETADAANAAAVEAVNAIRRRWAILDKELVEAGR